MAGALHKKWSKLKKPVNDECQKMLKLKKSDLGPDLDKYEKASAGMEKALKQQDEKKAAKLISEMKKLNAKLAKTVKLYDGIVKMMDKDSTDGKRPGKGWTRSSRRSEMTKRPRPRSTPSNGRE